MTAYMEHKDLSNTVIPDKRAREITDNVHRVFDEIAEAETQSGREKGAVTLLAATKTRDVGEIMAALDAGVRCIGENRPQEVIAKAQGLLRCCRQRGLFLGAASNAGQVVGTTVDMLASSDIELDVLSRNAAHVDFHLIGQLQSNKINKILPFINTVESVDSFELAQKIAQRAVLNGVTLGILLEVNESGEASKSGCDPQHAVELAHRIGELQGLTLQGLMTIGAHVDSEMRIRQGFAHLRETRDLILAQGESATSHCTELSMGMTHDLALAIQEGSTVVRVGTALFGERAFI